ncbi:MAG: YceI family protein [Bacteroidales bacterium]|nr:YceI family protein [Bacteroidales bacterium]
MKQITKKIITPIVAAFILASSLLAQEFNVNTDLSSVKWEGSKVVKGLHTGTIDVKSGTLSFKDGELVAGDLVIDMMSLSNTDQKGAMKGKLEQHLKSDDFFGVEKFPESRFELSSVSSLGDSGFTASGKLTIKSNTHPLKFDFNIGKEGDNQILTGKISIDRSLYDVKYGSGKFFDNLGDKAISDIFTLDFVLYLNE